MPRAGGRSRRVQSLGHLCFCARDPKALDQPAERRHPNVDACLNVGRESPAVRQFPAPPANDAPSMRTAASPSRTRPPPRASPRSYLGTLRPELEIAGANSRGPDPSSRSRAAAGHGPSRDESLDEGHHRPGCLRCPRLIDTQSSPSVSLPHSSSPPAATTPSPAFLVPGVQQGDDVALVASQLDCLSKLGSRTSTRADPTCSATGPKTAPRRRTSSSTASASWRPSRPGPGCLPILAIFS